VSEEDATGWMSKTVEAMTALLRTRGLTVSSVSTEGDPKHVLLDEAEQWGADCIFLGGCP
jgi:nucleotide-binding universal stress UspA family protein